MSHRRNGLARVLGGACLGVMVLMAACASSPTSASYDASQNHLHGILALSGVPNTVLVASHVGLYRSIDAGAHWQVVAGLAGQPMAGLMLFQVVQSSVDPQTLYVLAITRTDGPQVAHPQPGMYVSHDAGQTWALATALSVFPVPQIYALGSGSASAGDVYAISRATENFYHSADGGHTWTTIAPIPNPQGILGVGGQAALAWSITDGVYRTTDGGATWHAAAGIGNGIYAVAPVGALVYASGNDGVYVSLDGGAHFTLTATGLRFTTIIASAVAPKRAYGLAGADVQLTTDGGHSWQAVTPTSRHPGNLTIDPANPQTVYAGFSYPIGLDRTTDGGTSWQATLP